MKLISRGNIGTEVVGEQACSACNDVYELIVDDLDIGLFGLDDCECVFWKCPRCLTSNRGKELEKHCEAVRLLKKGKKSNQ